MSALAVIDEKGGVMVWLGGGRSLDMVDDKARFVNEIHGHLEAYYYQEGSKTL